MEKNKFILGKSSFMHAIQCPKALYLHKYHPELKNRADDADYSFNERNTRMAARGLFPGGADAGRDSPFRYDESFSLTRKHINEKSPVIYRAAFLYDHVMSAADMLVNTGAGWTAYEVRSSTSVTGAHIMDASFQYYVMKNSGLKPDDIFIIHINKEYVRKGNLDLRMLFRMESVLEKVISNQDFIEEGIKKLKKIASKGRMPVADIGPRCSAPYACEFTDHCRRHIPENSVFDIAGMSSNEKFNLYKSGIIRMEDVPYDYLSNNQIMQVEGVRKNKKHIDKDEIYAFTKSLRYPLYFIDFEAFRSAIPFFDYTRPYQQITFQYSLHHLKRQGGSLRHSEFIGKPGIDPRRDFITSLLKDTESKGDILVYNQTFEIARLRELGRDFPELSADIDERISRIKDLMIPFQKKHVYLPEMRGSYSIKRVLPALVPRLSYDDLEISNGGIAMNAYEELLCETDTDRTGAVLKDLLEYCRMDTLAMVRILQRLEGIAGRRNKKK